MFEPFGVLVEFYKERTTIHFAARFDHCCFPLLAFIPKKTKHPFSQWKMSVWAATHNPKYSFRRLGYPLGARGSASWNRFQFALIGEFLSGTLSYQPDECQQIRGSQCGLS